MNNQLPNNWHSWFPKEHITIDDLRTPDGFKCFALEISKITIKEITQAKGKKDNKPCAHFKGAQKYLILNSTMCQELESITGSGDPNQWIGTRVELFVTKVRKFGSSEMVDGVRIRRARPVQVAQPVIEQPVEVEITDEGFSEFEDVVNY